MVSAPTPTQASDGMCVGESVIVYPQPLGWWGGQLWVRVPMPPNCGSLIFDGQEWPGGPSVFRIFGLPGDWAIVQGTWYAIRADFDPQAVALRVAGGRQVWDMRFGAPVLLAGQIVPPMLVPPAPPGPVCAQESRMTGPLSSIRIGDGRQEVYNVDIVAGFNALIMDGQEYSGGPHVYRIFWSSVPRWTYSGATWWLICGDPIAIAHRINQTNPGEIWDMRTGTRIW